MKLIQQKCIDMSHFFIIKLCTNIVLLSDYKDFKCWLQMFAFISLETSNSFYIGTGLRGSQFESHWFGAFRLTKTIRITHRTQCHCVTGILLYVVATDVNNSCYLHSMISFLKCLRVHTPIYLQDRLCGRQMKVHHFISKRPTYINHGSACS